MKTETKVGALFIVTIALVVGFAYVLGAFSLFSNSNEIQLMYNFAGGIEKGSAVRVMGIKVGKVKSIVFNPGMKDANGDEVKLKITIEVSKESWATVKADSRFYINLAGVIGQKFIEISPGSADLPLLESGTVLRGVDPPRVDQLLSEGYGLAGKVIELIEKNEGSVTETLGTLNDLVKNTNKLLVNTDKLFQNIKPREFRELMSNLNKITGDVAVVSSRLRSEDTAKTIDLVHELIWRLDDLDKKAIKKFLQEEGIRARLF